MKEKMGLHIQMLGGFTVSCDGIAILDNQWKAGRARKLVKLMALTPGHQLHRDQVFDTLWPNLDPANAANNFYQTLHTARKTLEPLAGDCLYLKEGGLSLTSGKFPTLTIDVEQFENAVVELKSCQDSANTESLVNKNAVAVYKNALAFYSGDLLPGDLYEEWTTTRRETLRQAYQNLLLDLAHLHELRQEFSQGIDALLRLLASDHSHEEAHTELMRLYALSGQRQQALRQYQALREAQKEELDAEPGPKATALYKAILSGKIAPNPDALSDLTPNQQLQPLPRVVEIPSANIDPKEKPSLQELPDTGQIRPMMSSRQSGTPRPRLSHHATDSLTIREQEILALLAKGLSNGEIASQLHLALRTVKWYNSQIYSKLGASNRREAVAHVLQPGVSPSESEPDHNLPQQLTHFIGRQQETHDLITLLTKKEIRLVTILAPGGMGKTRLALAVAQKLLRQFHDGVFFVPLAPLHTANAMVTTVAECIGYNFYGEHSLQLQLIHYLKDRTMLLVMDNFEHLLNGAPFISELLQAAPGVRILATSRERLNLRGETIYTLSGLSFPAQDIGDRAQEYDAVMMFIESAQRVRMNAPLQSEDLNSIARICRLTAGMPLGIELAAGWVDVLSLQRIESELQKGIDILQTDLRDVPDRQRSIRATFEQTWVRLNAEEQLIFARLSVFRGGFTLTAAQTVAGASAYHLRNLAQKALIQSKGHEHFSVHELLRQFGAGKLGESGEVLAIQARHAAFFADFMAERRQDIKTNRQREALEMIELNFENLRTAWSYLVSHQQWEQMSAFLFSLWFYCDVRARGQEAIGMLEPAFNAFRRLPPSDAVQLALGRVLAPLGWFYKETGFAEKGATTCDEAIHILRQYGSPDDLIIALFDRQGAAFTLFQPGKVVNLAEEGLRIAQSIGDPYWEGHFLFWAGSGFQNGIQVSYKNTRQFTERALKIFEESGDLWGIMRAKQVLGEAWYRDEQQYEQAKYCFKQALSIAEMFAHDRSIAIFHGHLGQIALAEHDCVTARRHFRQALRVYWNASYQWLAPHPLWGFALSFADQHDFERAAMILATIQPYRLFFGQTDQKTQALREKLTSWMEPDRFEAAWSRGQQRSLDALVAEVLGEPDD